MPGLAGEFADSRPKPATPQPPLVQAKLAVSHPNDRYEQEADRVADRVMRMPDPRLQRQLEPEEEEEEEEALQTKLLVGRMPPAVQRQVEPEEEEEEEFVQTKPLIGRMTPLIQRQVEPEEEEEEALQTKPLGQILPLAQRQPAETSETPAETTEEETVVSGEEAASASVVSIEIQRDTETDESTLGTLTIGESTFETLELPDRDNAATGDSETAGRIPAGTYDAHIRTDGARGWRIELEDVTGRTYIQIHVGNTPDDTVGCILVGTARGENAVQNSTNARNQIQQIVENAGEGVTIQVTVTDPPTAAAEEQTAEGVPEQAPEGASHEAPEPPLQPKRRPDRANRDGPAHLARGDVVKGAGTPLLQSVRGFLEPRLRHDFSRVRVHTDAQAAESARAVSSRAFTVGRDIVFGAGQYAPETYTGRRLLAHELTHVIQQGGVPAGLIQRDNGDEQEEQEEQQEELRLRWPGVEPGSAFRLRLDPELEAEIAVARRMQQLLSPETFRSSLLQLDPSILTESVTPPWLTMPTPEAPEPLVPRGPGPETPRPGEASDALRALSRVPAVDAALTRLRTEALGTVERDWRRLSTGERALLITQTALIGGTALAGILASPEARRGALDLIQDRDLPVPGVPGLTFQFNVTGPRRQVMFRLNVGALLPPSWGFR
jgi:hypothetical protein